MAATDTLSAILQLLLMGDGLHDSDWGDQTNTNLQKLETAIAGATTIDLSTSPTPAFYTLSDDEARAGTLNITNSSGALTRAWTVYVPATTKPYLVSNQAGTAYPVVLQVEGGASGSGLSMPTTGYTLVVSNGATVGTLSSDTIPLGTVLEYHGLALPSTKYDWANGGAISRSSFAAYQNAVCLFPAITGGSGTVLNTSMDLTHSGVVGLAIECAGVPPNTTIAAVTSGTITISNAIVGGVGATATIFPDGNGDGSTTLNKPNRGEVIAIGRSGMGGVASRGLVTSFSVANGPVNVGVVFGSEGVSLTAGQLASHTHGVTDGGHSHGTTDPGHFHAGTITNTSNSGPAYVGYATLGVSDGADAGVRSAGAVAQVAIASSQTFVGVNSATTGISIQNQGSGTAHPNIQPVVVCNFIVRVA